MPKFRKKLVEIEAFQMTEAARWNNEDWPNWLNQAWNREPGEGAVWIDPDDRSGWMLVIGTLEGVQRVLWDDFIIRGVQGEIYPCKPDIFELTYEPKATALALAIREPFAKGRDHLTESGTFQSDKFPWCSVGFVPLKITDPAARDLLAEYARRREPIDAEFPRDLLEALENVPAKPNPDYLPFDPIGEETP